MRNPFCFAEWKWFGMYFEVVYLRHYISTWMKIELIRALSLCVRLKGIGVCTSALMEPQWDYISQHHLSFVTAEAIMASLQIHNCPILISSSQMWMARMNPPYFDGLRFTDDRCGYYSWLQCSPWPRHDHSNLCDTGTGAIASFPLGYPWASGLQAARLFTLTKPVLYAKKQQLCIIKQDLEVF